MMAPGPKSPREVEKSTPREEEFRGIEDLDRPELDEEEPDWANDTGVRRSPRSTPSLPPDADAHANENENGAKTRSA